ncbi:DUF1257 domain-containing protein [Blastopirellula marina]|uniref:DUF1257 domain-containing protein n=1 Tax=Blastopirellula marina TaxID=124 RepID=A0A2S8F8A6_9BACT|nr:MULTISPECIES: DUF1257 domain-containing protein [Pirellulaceae]PQO28398.1 DUF1257 domain-containing protein [Blastopirellula marina]RCS49104.1 DUF1257 domain-containing protein [Bremerella cremea]
MSHVVTIETKVRDLNALRSAANRLSLPAPTFGQTKLFNASAIGWRIELPGWQYPVVVDTDSGRLNYDNFEGRWGNPKELERLLQAYAIECATIEARKKGYTTSEQSLSDGSDLQPKN